MRFYQSHSTTIKLTFFSLYHTEYICIRTLLHRGDFPFLKTSVKKEQETNNHFLCLLLKTSEVCLGEGVF
jgi:hypothetical protein